MTRRFLPHWFVPAAVHFVTYRLHDSLPKTVLEELRACKNALLKDKPKSGQSSAQHRTEAHKRLFVQYDAWLDRGESKKHLSDPRIAALIRSNLYHHHGKKYQLLAYCVMPNHVHILIQPQDEGLATANEQLMLAGSLCQDQAAVGEQADGHSQLATIMHSVKSYTAHEANKILRRSGTFWQAESYDHWVRDDAELERIVAYIEANPVKAGLVKEPHDWFFCSAHDRFLTDGEKCGWLRWESEIARSLP